MGQTIIPVNDAKAVKKYSALLAVDVARQSYFQKKFSGKGKGTTMPIQVLTDLENEAGEYISYDLSMQMNMQPIEDDDKLENKEVAMEFYTDGIYINLMRGGVNGGGRMSRKRTIHDLRKVANARITEWWSRVTDEIVFMYLSGARGVNSDFVFPTTYTGFAGNSLTAPDAYHIHYANTANAKASMVAGDTMGLDEIDKAVTQAAMMGGGIQGVPKIQPTMVDGDPRFVLVMSPYDLHNVRTNASTGQWLDIQKAVAAASGENSRIFKGGAGVYNDVAIHSHQGVIRFSDYGSGAVLASRSLLLGRQAGVMAWGSPGDGFRFDWHEEMDDRGNVLIIDSAAMWGFKKTTFNGLDFGVYCIDAAAKSPVA